MNANTDRFIDKYEIVSTLGRGSMGVVYKGKDPEIGRLVAIKTLKTVFLGDDPAGNEALQRFRQESRSAGKLHHRNIVTIFEAGRTTNGSPYIVMEYIEGNSLEALVAGKKAIDPKAVVHYISQIADAVDYAHSQNVIHRDIKPSNILVDGRHKPYLLDFGVAKLSDTSLTPAGTVVGTPSYMSPEQIRGATLDGRTDLFSLAVVAFETFTGVRPFPGDDFTTVVGNIMNKPPLTFKELGVNLPAELESVLKQALSKERGDRYPTAAKLAKELARALGLEADGTGLLAGYGGFGGADAPLKPDSGKWSSTAKLAAVAPSAASGSGNSNAARGSAERAQVPPPPIPAPISDTDARTALHEAGREDPTAKRANPITLNSKGRSGMRWGILVILVAGIAAGLTALSKPELFSFSATPSTDEEQIQVVQVPDEDVPAPASDQLPAVTKDSAPKLDDAVLKNVLDSPKADVETLRIAIAEAGSRHKPIFNQSFVKLLSNENLAVQVSVLKALRGGPEVQQPDILPAIINCISDKDHVVRGFAAIALEKIDRPEVRTALERQLAAEQNPDIRKVLERVLRKSN